MTESAHLDVRRMEFAAAHQRTEAMTMLILTRREGESIEIGTGEQMVRVKVTRIQGDKVRIGIEAPDDMPVHREEIARLREAEERGEPVRAGEIGGAP